MSPGTQVGGGWATKCQDSRQGSDRRTETTCRGSRVLGSAYQLWGISQERDREQHGEASVCELSCLGGRKEQAGGALGKMRLNDGAHA